MFSPEQEAQFDRLWEETRPRDGSARFYAKRQAGISPIRKDGSETTAENDRQSEAAEKWAAEQLARFGAEFNDAVFADHGDGGKDFTIVAKSGRRLTVEVVWLGFRKGTIDPRVPGEGNLIVNPDEPQRHADLYVSVSGSIERGFEFNGYCTHAELVVAPPRNFGFGEKWAVPSRELRQFQLHE